MKRNAECLSRCRVYLKGKARYCGQKQIENGQGMCFFHFQDKDQNRVQCPYDGKHLLRASKIESHLKKCNKRPEIVKRMRPFCYEEDICAGSSDGDDEKQSKEKILSSVDEIYLDNLLNVIEKILLAHYVGEDEKEQLEFYSHLLDEVGLKHKKQISSLLGHLDKHDFLKKEYGYCDFGGGRGRLSYFLNQICSSNSHVIVDRGRFRHKSDNRNDVAGISRILIDIKDFNMKLVGEFKNVPVVVCVGKHLCGSATDMSLRCGCHFVSNNANNANNANNSNSNNKDFGNIAFFFALCCHHRCSWKAYVNKEFLIENGIKKIDFQLICAMSSWAVDGSEFCDRKIKGLLCKDFLNLGRRLFLEKKGFTCSLVNYVGNDISPENKLLIAISKEKQKKEKKEK